MEIYNFSKSLSLPSNPNAVQVIDPGPEQARSFQLGLANEGQLGLAPAVGVPQVHTYCHPLTDLTQYGVTCVFRMVQFINGNIQFFQKPDLAK